MSASFTLLKIVGDVIVLLWGLHMVQSGLVRAFGPRLRHILGVGLRNRFTAFLAGMGVTATLQSSMATALMTTSFAAEGAIALTPALAVMLGANVATTLIVQLMSSGVLEVAPVLLLVGFVAFRRGRHSITKDLGRAGIGLGLMLSGLHMLSVTMKPITQDPFLQDLMTSITSDPFITLAISALFTWVAHSSAAMVLLISTLLGANVIPVESGLVMVAGANLGIAFVPLLEGARGNPAAKRMPVGNLINRAVGCLLILPFLTPLAHLMESISVTPLILAANFHTFFNLALALIFLLPLPLMSRFLMNMFPDLPQSEDPSAPRYLDPAALTTPTLALANASRETLRMADIIEIMLRGALEVMQTDDRDRTLQIRQMDGTLDRLHDGIKRYVTQISLDGLDEQDARRASDVLSYTVNLEHVGDIIDKNLMELVNKKIKNNLTFSDEGRKEIVEMLERIIRNIRLSSAVFVTGDLRSARELLEEKRYIRTLETHAIDAHFARLRAGRRESLETSALHLDLLRDLRRISAHLTSSAYPILNLADEAKKLEMIQNPT